MLTAVMERRAADWEELARREPYFAILTNEGALDVSGSASATAAFFDTGEADVAALLEAITSLLGRDLCLDRALDFGCGVGRLTLPLARRSVQVVGCDIAPTMLVHARQNAQNAGLRNITFIDSEELSGLAPGEFDLICSLLVFEHIPPAVGTKIIRTLMNLLAPGGVGAIQISLRSRGGGRDNYDDRRILRQIDASGAHLVALLPTHQDGSQPSAIMVIEKGASSARLA